MSFARGGILNPGTLIGDDGEICTNLMMEAQGRLVHSPCRNPHADTFSLGGSNSLFDSITYLIGLSRDRAIVLVDDMGGVM